MRPLATLGAVTANANAVPGALEAAQHYNDGWRGWPVRPHDEQHPVRGSFLDPRPDKTLGATYHSGVDVARPRRPARVRCACRPDAPRPSRFATSEIRKGWCGAASHGRSSNQPVNDCGSLARDLAEPVGAGTAVGRVVAQATVRRQVLLRPRRVVLAGGHRQVLRRAEDVASQDDGAAAEPYWDTTRLANGRYRLRVRVWDATGHTSKRDSDVTIAN
jgi:hypothetical protein